MIAVDTNILVYAHRSDSEWHAAARDAVSALAEGRGPWAIAWPCVHEFVAIVTHPRIYRPPTPLARAIAQVDAWFESPTLVRLGEDEGYWEHLRETLVAGRIIGAQVHDARVAAICLANGVTELWTHDRDFTRFPSLTVSNPLVR